jgi:hypothetical protein
MKRIALLLCLSAASPLRAGLQDVRELLKSDPGKAAARLSERLASRPDDPWLIYNAAVGGICGKGLRKS